MNRRSLLKIAVAALLAPLVPFQLRKRKTIQLKTPLAGLGSARAEANAANEKRYDELLDRTALSAWSDWMKSPQSKFDPFKA